MRAGQLRHRVTIQQFTQTQNEYGEIVEGWTTFATVWAAVEPLRGREFWDAQQLNAEVTARIRLRYLSGVGPTMRVVYDGRTFEVDSVIDVDERHRELQLMCKEVVV